MNDPGTVQEEFTANCTACGLCAAMCPPLSHRTVQLSDVEIQEQVREYLEAGPPTEAVCDRSRLCNECYKCVTDTCPQGLDPMRVNQLLRGLLNQDGTVPRPFIPPLDPQSSERIISSLLTTEEEFKRITTPSVKGDGRVVFSPGCNIYYQPHLLLTALDICDRIASDWSFLPGLTHCCGNNHDSSGRLVAGANAMEELVSSLGGSGVQTIVVWCPTCAARFHHDGSDLPVISFARFVADRLNDGLVDKSEVSVTVTLQEACKVGYLELDPLAPRELLKLVTGAPVREMDRHGTGTVCCGWSLHSWLPAIGDEDRRQRLGEAAATGAGTLVTVCHGCQWILDSPGIDPAVRIVNYIRLVGEALGIRHEERCRKLREIGDTEAILNFVRRDMGDRFGRLPFDSEQIRQTVESVLGSTYWGG
jgi:heterodisulfide reductase subunit D